MTLICLILHDLSTCTNLWSCISQLIRYFRACVEHRDFLSSAQLLKKDYIAATQLYFITNSLSVTKYPFFKWQYIFSLLRRCFLYYITSKTLSGLDYEPRRVCRIRNWNCLPFEKHWVHSRRFKGVPDVHLVSFLCYVMFSYLSSFCILCTKCCQCLWIIHSSFLPSVFSNVYLLPTLCHMSRVPNVAGVSDLSILVFYLRFSPTFIYYLHSVICLVYPMLPVSLIYPFLNAPSVFCNLFYFK
jgi:hypothetical protein